MHFIHFGKACSIRLAALLICLGGDLNLRIRDLIITFFVVLIFTFTLTFLQEGDQLVRVLTLKHDISSTRLFG